MEGFRMKKLIGIFLAVLVMASFTGCETEADRVSYNIGQEADNFNVQRRLVAINSRTDKVIFEVIGTFSYEVNDAKKRIEIICEVGPNQYKKHFIGYSDSAEMLYSVEDVSGSNVSKYQYEINILPQMIKPITFVSKN